MHWRRALIIYTLGLINPCDVQLWRKESSDPDGKQVEYETTTCLYCKESTLGCIGKDCFSGPWSSAQCWWGHICSPVFSSGFVNTKPEMDIILPSSTILWFSYTCEIPRPILIFCTIENLVQLPSNLLLSSKEWSVALELIFCLCDGLLIMRCSFALYNTFSLLGCL